MLCLRCTWCARRSTTGATCICPRRGRGLVDPAAVSMFELGDLSARWWQAGARTNSSTVTADRNLIFAAGVCSVGSLWLIPFASYVMQAACFFTTGFFVFILPDAHWHGGGGVFRIRRRARPPACCATYLGASLSGWPLAKVLEIWHWTGFCGHRHRGGDLRAIAVAISERLGPTRDRSVMHLTFCAEWGEN